MKQAVKKKSGTKTKTSIADIKAALKLTIEKDEDLVKSSADKEMEFIPMPVAYQEATKLPGIPMGYITISCGWSNTGKSTLKNCLIASCINNGILPVIYETENNFDFQYAIDCGMKATPVYGDFEVEVVDEETGEITTQTEQRIINYEGDFIYFDTAMLAEQYGDMDYSQGKRVSKKRKRACIEDIAYSMNEILDLQDEGVIQQPICFIWDSVGSIASFKTVNNKIGNNMYDAGAIANAFNDITNSRIPTSRKVSSPYTNTMFLVNKIWNDSMNSMGGVPSIELKGGKSLYYATRLILFNGKIGKSGVKKLTATAKGQTVTYGIVTTIRVNKNHLPKPYNLSGEGEMACVHNGLLSINDIDKYKKEHLKDILKQLESVGTKVDDIKESDITFGEEESNE